MNKAVKSSSGLFKKVALAGLVLGLLGTAAIVAVVALTDWDALVDESTQFLSEKLGREISVGEIELDIFSFGIKLNDVTVANGKGFSEKPLFKNEEAEVDLSVLSLLTGKVVLETIRFSHPDILIEQNKAGKFNFSDMIPRESTAASSVNTGLKNNPSKEKEENLALPVSIVSLQIEHANFVFIGPDHQSQGFQDLNLKLSGFSLEAAGKSLLEINLKANTEGKEIPIAFKMLFDLDLPGDRLHIKQWSLVLPSLNLDGKGSIEKMTTRPQLDVETRIVLNLNSFVKDLAPPSVLKKYPPDLKTKGTITTELKLKGPAENPLAGQAQGSVSFAGVGVSYGDYPAMDSLKGKIVVTPRRLNSTGLDFNLASSPVRFKMSADYTLKNLMGKTKDLQLMLRYDLSSPHLVIDPIMAWLAAQEQTAVVTGGGTAVPSGTASQGPLVDYRKIVPVGFQVDGWTRVDSFQLEKIKTGSMKHHVTMKNRKAKTTFDMDLFGGNIHGQANANLNVPGIAYGFDFSVNKMQIAPFADAAVASYPDKETFSKLMKQFKGKVSGALTARARGKGHDIRLDPMIKNLNMAGDFKISNAVLKQIAMQKKIAAVIPHAGARTILGHDIHLEYFGGKFTMAVGKFVWTRLRGGSGRNLRDGDLYLESHGAFYPPEGAIRAVMTPYFNPRVVNLGKLQSAFSDSHGWARYEIGYKGASLETAKADFSKGAAQVAKKALKDKAQSEIKKQIKKQSKDLFKKLPGGLKNLFGR